MIILFFACTRNVSVALKQIKKMVGHICYSPYTIYVSRFRLVQIFLCLKCNSPSVIKAHTSINRIYVFQLGKVVWLSSGAGKVSFKDVLSQPKVNSWSTRKTQENNFCFDTYVDRILNTVIMNTTDADDIWRVPLFPSDKWISKC